MELKIDVEDLEDMLLKIEESFDIKFESNELVSIKTYGELCDAIKSKICAAHKANCTSQQAYYKLRNALSSSLDIERTTIRPSVTLESLFPRKTRRSQIKGLERDLGLKLSILRPPHFVIGLLVSLMLASLIMFFIVKLYGLMAFGLVVSGFYLSNKFGNVLSVKNVRELSLKMTREHYMKSRRNSETINKNELDEVLEDWFVDFLGLKKSELTRDARLF